MENPERGRGEVASLMERILYEVKRIVVGQDHFLERCWWPFWPRDTCWWRGCRGWPRP